MKKHGKGFIAGVLTTLLVMSFGVTAFAAYQKQTTLNYDNIKVTVNGKAVTPTDAAGKAIEPFIIDGTTYLPVRAIANALGLEVGWDQATKTVKLGKGESTTGNNLLVPSGTYSRTNPAPIGAKQTITIDNYDYQYTVSITISEVLSSTEMKNIMGSTVANDAPDKDCEFVAAKIHLSLDKVTNIEKSETFSSSDFEVFTKNNEKLDSKYVYLKDDNYLNAVLYQGGTAEGYLILQKQVNDSNAKVVFGRNYDGTSGIWFSLAK